MITKRITLLFLLTIMGCQRMPEEVQKEIDRLTKVEAEKQDEVYRLKRQEADLKESIAGLSDNQLVMKALSEGKRIQYVLYLKVQYRERDKETLDVSSRKSQLKVLVSADYYSQVSVGEKLVEKRVSDEDVSGVLEVIVAGKERNIVGD